MSQPPPEPDGRAIRLATIRNLTGADAVQWVRYEPAAKLVADCAPSPEISANLLQTAADVRAGAKGARSIANTYRFSGRLVHLIASSIGPKDWLLVWLRLPEGASPEAMAAVVELAASALSAEFGKDRPETPGVLRAVDFSARRPVRLRQLCQWVAQAADVPEIWLAHKGLLGWRVTGAVGQLPTRTGPLAHAIVHAIRGQAGESARQEIQRLSGQPAAGVHPAGARHVLISAGPRAELPPEVMDAAVRILPAADPHATPLHTFAQRWRETPALRRKWIIGGSLALVAILLFPVHQRIRTDAILEPSVRRFIAAPFNGVVKKVHVRAGEVVEPGQLLVELDGREIAERLSEVEARLSSAVLQNATELESSNYSEAAVKALDAQSLAHERDLLKYRRENLRLVSPIRGVIVTGELERSEGAAVELGKPLLELAPLDEMVAEIAVDESDVAIVRAGMKTSIKLNALPGRTFTEEVFRVAPRSETRDSRNVFVAEAEIANANDQLRPGMKGKAVIYSWRRPLIWTLIRKPWQVVQRWLFR